ncbi:DOMON-like domain-containing protein [bacterium BD-1]|nr:DOMON-like domain-containing protein [Ottowia caeni]
MTTPFSQRFAHALIRHPATPCDFVRSITVEAHRCTEGATEGLHLRYRLIGQVSQLRLPSPAQEPGPRDGLWKHTCFEAFIGQPGEECYREFNFSPSGHWAAYAFSEERVRDAEAPDLPSPRITFTPGPDELILEARLPLAAMLIAFQGPLHMGLTAVIETQDGRLSYWALHHPAEQPDFHRKDGWTALLTTP